MEPWISRLALPGRLRQAHRCLHLTPAGRFGADLVPGKLFGAVGAERPLLALAPEGSISRLIRELDIGGAVSPHDLEAVVSALSAARRCAGWRTRYVPEAESVHLRGACGASSAFVEYHLVRNRLWFSLRSASLRDLALELPGLALFERVKLIQPLGRPHLRAARIDQLADVRQRRCCAVFARSIAGTTSSMPSFASTSRSVFPTTCSRRWIGRAYRQIPLMGASRPSCVFPAAQSARR